MPATTGYGQGGYGAGPYGGYTAALPISYYLSLITSEYQNSPNMLAWLTAVLQVFDDISQVISQIPEAFDVNSAVGVQLDALGTLIGVSRTLSFQPSNSVSPTLDDDTYRLLLRAQIARNYWDGTIDGLQGIWKALFPGGTILILDNQNMSADITVSGAFSSIILDMIAGFAVNGATTGVMTNSLIIPRPEGVQYNFVFGDFPYFGFGSLFDAVLGIQIISGFDTGKWT